MEMQTKRTAKYLGVKIDTKMSFGEQIRSTAEKAAKGVAALSKLMANVNGPRPGKRKLLMSAVQSVLLYGAEVWAQALNKEVHRKRLAQVQRRGALRVASAYRTVSEPAVLVIAGVIPIALLAFERQANYRRREEGDRKSVRKEERARILQTWQESWEQETRGRWTARLITSVRAWTERQHGEISYYLTQLLSGHGYFRSYLYKMGKATAPDCLYCPGAKDDAEHTFFQCERWTQHRRSLEEQIGQQSPDNIIEAMLRSQDNWTQVLRYTEEILRSKKEDLG